ncbi:MAG: hypothetical protein FKY71_16380 [Spiribacter salinus]|uniref:Uncharacterized protein n=1 Tax=Spiribacter salinus TaxID=1335746 RepID=A0A540VJK1_9GAMM|nr:MAG: hypothetical protein FKY71_16380 [Spiribacter salinus]
MTDHPNPAARWFHRRVMAYLCLSGSLLYPLLILATDSKTLADMAWTFYGFTGSVVAMYTGATIVESFRAVRG